MTFSKLAVVGLSVFALGGSVALAGDATADRAQLTAAKSAAATSVSAPQGCGECCAKRAASTATYTDRG